MLETLQILLQNFYKLTWHPRLLVGGITLAIETQLNINI